MSVDANIYRTAEMAEYIPTFPFARAEVIEAQMAGRPLERRFMLCEPTPTVLNLAVNRVQHTFKNRHGGISAESLNGAFLSGFAMDLRPFLGKTFDSCHVEVEISMVPDGRTPPSGRTAPSSPGWRPRHVGRAEARDESGSLAVSIDGRDKPEQLNPTAAAIWELCDGTRTLEEIGDELTRRFRANAQQLERDVRSAVGSFLELNLLEQSPRRNRYRRIDLTEIPCFLINCKKDADKRRFMERQLSDLGIRFEIVPALTCDPAWFGVALSHLKALRLPRADHPFLVLEDDCAFNELFHPVWDVPAETDALYLGASEFGLEEPGKFSWGRPRKARWEPYDPSYLRVRNMLARHAVVYITPQYTESVIQSQIVALTNPHLPYPGDIGCAMLHDSHVILTPNDPVCRQTERASTARSLRSI